MKKFLSNVTFNSTATTCGMRLKIIALSALLILNNCALIIDTLSSDDASLVKAPPPPSSVKASADLHSVTLSWDAVKSAAYYYVYIADDVKGPFDKDDKEKYKYTYDTSVTFSDLEMETHYYFKINAANSSGENISNEIIHVRTDRPAPPAPQNINVELMSSSSVKINWDSVLGAASYNVYRRPGASGKFKKITDTAVQNTSWKDSGLEINTIYSYKITAFDGEKESVLSDAVSIITPQQIFGAPQNVSALTVSSTQVLLTWDDMSDAQFYYIYRYNSPDDAPVFLADCTLSPYLAENLQAGTKYYFRVSAQLIDGEGPQSEAAIAVTADADTPGEPEEHTPGGGALSSGTWKTAVIAGGTTHTYTYNAANNKNYYIEWNDAYSGDGTCSGDVIVSALKANGGEIVTGRDHGYGAARVFFSTGTNESGTVTIQVDFAAPGTYAIRAGIPPDAPKITQRSSTDSAITLQWDSVPNVTSYTVYRSSTDSGLFASLDTVSSNTYTDTTVSGGNAYYYKLVSNSDVNGVSDIENTAPAFWVAGNNIRLLLNNVWHDDVLAPESDIHYYAFQAASNGSGEYALEWDSAGGSGNFSASVIVSAYLNDGTLWLNADSNGYSSERKKTVLAAHDYVIIKVQPASADASDLGTYRIKYFK